MSDNIDTPHPCEQCGETRVTRPYGPQGELICFKCGQKDPVTTFRQCIKVMHGIEMPDEIAERGAAIITARIQEFEIESWDDE